MSAIHLEVTQCRTCINECIDYLSLHEFLFIGDEPTTLAEMLAFCINLEIPENELEVLPKNVCKSCIAKLEESYSFKKMVLHSQNVLAQNVEMDYADEDEPQPREEKKVVVAKQAEHDEDFLLSQLLGSAEEDIPSNFKQENGIVEEDSEIELIDEHCKNEFEIAEQELVIENIEEAEKEESQSKDNADAHSEINEAILIEEVETLSNGDSEEFLTVDSLEKIEDSNADTENENVSDSSGNKMDNLKTNPNLYTCEICGRTYHHESRLKSHLESHCDDKHFICEYCGKKLKNNKCYKNHVAMHTQGKKYKCDTCGRLFGNQTNLQVHRRQHTGERPFKCDQCDQAFVTNDMLKRHIYLHTGERPFACDKCDKSYRDQSNLKAHQRTHDISQMFACEVCGLKLTQMAGYRKHMRVHNGEMPYKCHICERRFRYSSNLYAHVRLHSGEKPFKCTSCTKAFPTAKRLRLHSKVHEFKTVKEQRKQTERRGGGRAPDVPDQKVIKSNVVLLY